MKQHLNQGHPNQGAARQGRGHAVRVPGWALATSVPLLALVLYWPGPAAGAAAPPMSDAAKLAQQTEKRLGVKIRGVRLSAAGFMLDLRYRVLDAAKAAPLLDRKIHPYLEDSNGARLGVPASPKVGPLRSTRRGGEILMDRDYSMLFGNPGRYLKPGSRITLVVGEHKIENLVVE